MQADSQATNSTTHQPPEQPELTVTYIHVSKLCKIMEQNAIVHQPFTLKQRISN